VKSWFQYFYRKSRKKQVKSSDDMILLGKKVLFFLFFMSLLLYPHYSPYSHITHDMTWFSHFFWLYSFVVNQTLGIIHESGHGICYLFSCPKFVMVLNGTLFQVGFPLGVAYYYRQRKNLFAYYTTLFIIGISLQYTAWYISTANEGRIVPATKSFLGVDGYHDFYYLLKKIGLLSFYSEISFIVQGAAYGLMIYAVWKMFHASFGSPRG